MIKHVIEIRELNTKNNYVINDIIKTNDIDNLDIDYKIKINEYSFTIIDNNSKNIDEVFFNYVIGTKLELKFYSQEMLNNKLNSIKIVYKIFNKNISMIEEIVKEKISQIIKKIIFDDIINEEDLIYL